MRPDTPELEAEDEMQARASVQEQNTTGMTVQELNQQLSETARQASLEERACEIAAREELENNIDDAMDDDESAVSRAPTPPPVEFNSQGRLTARSKGKGRAD